MELAAAVVAVVEVTSRASSALWKLGEEWKNAPRDIYQLRDDVDRAVSLYRVVQASIAPPENPKGGDGYRAQVVRGGGDNGGGPGEALVADELKLLVLEGESAVSRIQAMIDNLMHTSGTPFAAADIIPKMRRLAWLRNQAKVRYLQSVLRRNLDQLGMHLVLLNLTITTNIPSKVVELTRRPCEGWVAGSPTDMEAHSDDIGRLVKAASDETLLSRYEAVPVEEEIADACPPDRGAAREERRRASTLRSVETASKPASLGKSIGIDRAAAHHQPDSTDQKLVQALKHLLAFNNNEVPLKDPPTSLSVNGSFWSDFIKQTTKGQLLLRGCDGYCKCICHSIRSYGGWSLTRFQDLLGSFQISFTGLSLFGTMHSDHTCLNRESPHTVNLHYRFPNWLLAGTCSIFYSKFANQGPELLIRVRHVVNHHEQPHSRDDIFVAVYNGDLDAVKSYIVGRCGSLNSAVSVQLGRTPLHIAISMRRIPIVKLLLQAGADLYQPDDNGVDPVTTAFQLLCVGSESAKPFAEIISFEKHIDDEDYADLHKVVIGFLPLNLDEALQSPRLRSEVNSRSRSGLAPLHLARDVETIRKLIAAGADPNSRTPFGLTALMNACELGRPDVVKELLDSGASIEQTYPNGKGKTPLMSAAISTKLSFGADSFAVLKLLLSRGADPNKKHGSNGGTALHIVASGRSVECLKIMIEAGAMIDERSFSGETPLCDAIYGGCCANARLLLDNGANYRVVTDHGESILHILAASGSVEMMEEFASRKMTGVDPLMKNVAGKTPRDVFDTRVDKANEEPIVAFKQLLASVNATSEEDAGQDEQDDEVGKGDDFHDALEAQTDEAEMH